MTLKGLIKNLFMAKQITKNIISKIPKNWQSFKNINYLKNKRKTELTIWKKSKHIYDFSPIRPDFWNLEVQQKDSKNTFPCGLKVPSSKRTFSNALEKEKLNDDRSSENILIETTLEDWRQHKSVELKKKKEWLNFWFSFNDFFIENFYPLQENRLLGTFSEALLGQIKLGTGRYWGYRSNAFARNWKFFQTGPKKAFWRRFLRRTAKIFEISSGCQSYFVRDWNHSQI